MNDPQHQQVTGVSTEVSIGGDIVGVPHCAVCDARESLRTPLTLQPDGSYLCATHVRARLREGTRQGGAGALLSDGAIASTPLAPGRPAPPPNSPYEILGVPLDATADEIEAARKKLQQYWLPRRAGAQRGRAEEMLDRIAVMYDELIDPTRRRVVDENLRKRAAEEQEARLIEQVSPLEDWAGGPISSLKDFETACESSSQNWRIGEGILLNGGLFSWVRYSLQNLDAARAIERTLNRNDLSNMRKLNEFLYRIDPERPYRFFTQPGAFEPINEGMSIHSVQGFIKFADEHWDLTVQHLYDGELVAWLDAKAVRGVYGNDYYETSQFFDEYCKQFARTQSAGVGLEKLLEFLDPDLPKPKIRVTFGAEENGYTLLNWDGELPHRSVIMNVQNTTRGYYAGAITLTPPEAKQISSAPWVSLSPLPLEAPPIPAGNLATGSWSTNPQETSCELKGAISRPFTFYLGNFNAQTRGRTYTRTVTLKRFEASPTQAHIAGSFALKLQLMRFLGGYRLALWLRGLRGGIPGLLLNGGIGYVVGW